MPNDLKAIWTLHMVPNWTHQSADGRNHMGSQYSSTNTNQSLADQWGMWTKEQPQEVKGVEKNKKIK